MRRCSRWRVASLTAILLLGLVATGTVFAGGAAAQSDDTSEPIVTNATVLNDSVAPGDTLVIEANATDESSLIEAYVELDLRNNNIPYETRDGPNGSFVLSEFNRSGLGTSGVRFETTVSDTRINGTYELYRVGFIDAAGNQNESYQNSWDSVEISNPTVEPEDDAPTIQSVDLQNDTVEPGDEIAVDVAASDASEIVSITAELEYNGDLPYDSPFNGRIQLEASDSQITQNGTTRLIGTIPETQLSGDYRVDRVELTDEFGNRNYSNPDTDFNTADLTVQNVVQRTDTTEPTITDVRLLNSSVQPGQNVTVELDVTDDESRIVEAKAVLNHENYYDENTEIELEAVDNRGLGVVNETADGKTIRLTTTVPETQIEGQYQLGNYDVSATDAARNTKDRAATVFTKSVSVNNANIDTDGPNITNVTVLNQSITASEELVMTADVSDASGIGSVEASFNRTRLPRPLQTIDDDIPNDRQITSKLSFTVENESSMTADNGTVTLSTTVPTSVYSGDYKLTSLRATDSNGTVTEVGDSYTDYRYGGNLQVNYGDDRISPLTRVTVSGDDPTTIDTTSPVVTEFSVLNNTVEPGSELVFDVNSTDPTGLSLVSGDLKSAVVESTPGVLPEDMRFTSDGSLTSGVSSQLSVTIPEDSATGTLSTSNLSIYDTDRNAQKLSTEVIRIGTIVAKDSANGTHTSIQAAIDSASDGDTVEVRPGTYREELTINKDIRLVAPDGATLNGSTLGAGSTGITVPAGSTAGPEVTGFAFTGYSEAINATDAAAEVDASRNYWGAADGPGGDYPGSGSAVVGAVAANPFYTDASLSTLSTPVSGDTVTTLDGTNATVQFTLKNDRRQNNSYILNLSLPDGWTPVSYADDGGSRQTNESKWLWQTITPGETVSPSVTLRVPEDSNGTYNISGTALIEGETEAIAYGNATVDVVDTNLTVSAGDQSLSNGSETSLTVEAPLTNGTLVEVTDQAVYNSSDTDVVTVDANGTVTAVGVGTAAVNVSYDGQNSSIEITVESATVEQAIDEDNSGEIDDVEILTAIGYWQDDEAVPQTGGETIDDVEILDLIEKWRNNTEL
jgi:hypothetical protein